MTIKSTCPLCRKPSSGEFTPFCSRGCRDRDLLAWMDGRYALPAAPDLDDEMATPTNTGEESA